jgi:hypothetical protein
MSRLYRNESSDPKTNAQRNLQGRTHFVDDDTLRFHKSRVISARHTDNGLLFAVVTSDAKDMNNHERGFRFTIFDVFGNRIYRKSDQWFRKSDQAVKAMWSALNEMDAIEITRKAIERAERRHAMEMDSLRAEVDKIAHAEPDATLLTNGRG